MAEPTQAYDETAFLVRPLHDRIFRSNQAFEFILLDHLSNIERQLLESAKIDSFDLGVLRPRHNGLLYKIINNDVSLLFLAMASPGTIPQAIFSQLGDTADKILADLVLDGVLEVEAENGFVWGAESHSTLIEKTSPISGSHPLSQLSIEALQHVDVIGIDDPHEIARALYTYPHLPNTVSRRAAIPTDGALIRYLKVPRTFGRPCETSTWFPVEPPHANSRWLVWCRTGSKPFNRPSCFKLYVSPQPDDLPLAIERIVPLLWETRAVSMKIGRDLESILRPDKMIVYFETESDLRNAAPEIAIAVSNLNAHGVPFTAPLDDIGVISWGVDPDSNQWTQHLGGKSWRRWVTYRLAIAIAMATARAQGALEPWLYALRSIERDGIDPNIWQPKRA